MEETWGNLRGWWWWGGGGIFLVERTCWGILETSSPQDMHLCHLLRVATQGAPAGAGGLIQAQLSGTGQRRKGGKSQSEARKMKGEGVSRSGEGKGSHL